MRFFLALLSHHSAYNTRHRWAWLPVPGCSAWSPRSQFCNTGTHHYGLFCFVAIFVCNSVNFCLKEIFQRLFFLIYLFLGFCKSMCCMLVVFALLSVLAPPLMSPLLFQTLSPLFSCHICIGDVGCLYKFWEPRMKICDMHVSETDLVCLLFLSGNVEN